MMTSTRVNSQSHHPVGRKKTRGTKTHSMTQTCTPTQEIMVIMTKVRLHLIPMFTNVSQVWRAPTPVSQGRMWASHSSADHWYTHICSPVLGQIHIFTKCISSSRYWEMEGLVVVLQAGWLPSRRLQLQTACLDRSRALDIFDEGTTAFVVVVFLLLVCFFYHGIVLRRPYKSCVIGDQNRYPLSILTKWILVIKQTRALGQCFP